MINKKTLIFSLSTGIIFFGIVYCCVAFWYLSVTKKSDKERIQNHAVVIAHDLWILNNSGMYAYLDLVAKTDHYNYLEVLAETGETFLKIAGPEIGAIDRALYRVGLVTTERISYPIIYYGQNIGNLEGQRYIVYFYFLFYLFLILFFSAITLTFVLYLFFHRRLLEQQVRERTRRYQELVNLLPEMVIETDADGNITFANEKAMECFGFIDTNGPKHDFRDYILQENGEKADLSLFHNENKNIKTSGGEYRLRCGSESLLPVLVRSAPMYVDGNWVGARMIIVDIAERKSLEEQLNRDQKMKSIGMMASGIAHDLNNILSGIINYPELILHQVSSDSPLIKLIKPMQKAGLQAAEVVADLLIVARGVAAAKQVVDLNEIVNEYINSPEFEKLQSTYPKIGYEIDLAAKLSPVSCSIIHVRKCLMNLMNNASEAIEQRGQVTIRTANMDLINPIKTVYGLITPGSYVVLTVGDTGHGIPHREMLHIFEPFYSKKELGRSGTGLGLAIVWNTMQDHNGSINVISTDKGTSFELYFLRTTLEREVLETRSDREMLRGNGETILVVDDEPQQRDIATRLLQGIGYNVESVSSGELALEYVRHKKVDLILLDMIMDPGMNGRKTYEELKRIHPGQKAIILSGFSESDDVKETMRLGAGGLLNKPYSTEQLARAVWKELARDAG